MSKPTKNKATPKNKHDALIRVKNLSVDFQAGGKLVHAVKNVSFEVGQGETVALVGESGSGKTVTALSILQLLPYPAASHPSGVIEFQGENLMKLPPEALRRIRGNKISMIFQEPMTSLNPLHTIEDQVGEVLKIHRGLSDRAAKTRVIDLLNRVGIEDPESRLASYPHQLSGGQRQRVMIAMALANEPDLLIADEPTTALDVIVQDKLLREMRTIQENLGMGMIYISHDVAVIAEVSQRIGVMYAGRMAELAASADIFERPLHPYTYALMSAFPSIIGPRRQLTTLGGEPPDLLNPPPGCRFHPRCSRATDVCKQEAPPYKDYGGKHYAACWHPMGE